MRRSLRDVGIVDKRLVQRSAELPPSQADRALKTLTRSANRSLLWLGVAAVLATRRGPTRRAAARSVVAVAGASAGANLIAKQLFPRRRPAAELMPARRRLTKRPTSSSFPSGHAASAAAFTTAVIMERPVLGAALAPLAGAVAYSRVHTGVHWPSDVAAGALLGVAAGLATRRWWPVGADQPATARELSAIPAITGGEGVLALVNPGSGVNGEAAALDIGELWPKATIVYPAEGQDLVKQLDSAVEEADRPPTALAVAGGDGTVAAVATVAARRRLPLIVVPSGTLNHFARDIGVDGIESVATAMAGAQGVRVDLGTVRVDDRAPRWFVNTASLGGYPDMVRLRQRWEKRWGKWPAAGLALVRVLAKATPLRLTIDGEPHLVWMLFVGNGRYLPKGFAPTTRPRLDTGLMDVRYIRAEVRFSRLRFVLAALTGALHRSRTYRHLEVRELEVEVSGGAVAIATDGEVGPRGSRFHFRAEPAALGVYR